MVACGLALMAAGALLVLVGVTRRPRRPARSTRWP
jgi:hypothetical protein